MAYFDFFCSYGYLNVPCDRWLTCPECAPPSSNSSKVKPWHPRDPEKDTVGKKKWIDGCMYRVYVDCFYFL